MMAGFVMTVISPQAPDVTPLRRELGRVVGDHPGPALIVVGSLHGNEPAGVAGLQRLFQKLRDGRHLNGQVVGLAGNLAALEVRRRYVVQDLNRIWRRERVERVRHAGEHLDAEAAEMAELEVEIRRTMEASRRVGQPVFLLDLHTTSGGGPSFVVMEDTLPIRTFARRLEAPMVLGLEEELSGTLAHWLADNGVVSVGFEAGQHDDPAAPERAEAAIWLALEASGVLEPGVRPEVEEARHRLRREARGLPRVVEVRYRHGIEPEDRFEMAPGYHTFERVVAGQTVAVDRRGAVRVPEGGLLLMPLYQSQGEDGFFVVRKVAPAWLKLSSALRQLRLERALHLLPGVKRHPDLPGGFLVDKRWARFFALEVFHLLGFRRRGPAGGRYLVMRRRSHDV